MLHVNGQMYSVRNENENFLSRRCSNGRIVLVYRQEMAKGKLSGKSSALDRHLCYHVVRSSVKRRSWDRKALSMSGAVHCDELGKVTAQLTLREFVRDAPVARVIEKYL